MADRKSDNRFFTLPVKAAALFMAVILLCGSVLMIAVSWVTWGLAWEYGGTADAARQEVVRQMAGRYADNICRDYWMIGTAAGMEERYRDLPFTFTVAEDGETIVSTHTGGDAPEVISAQRDFTYDMWAENDGQGDTLVTRHITATVYADRMEEYPGSLMSRTAWAAEVGYTCRWWLLVAGIVGWILAIGLVIFLHCAAGRHPGEEQPRCNAVDRMPLELFLLFPAAGVIGGLILLAFLFDEFTFAGWIALLPVGILWVFLLLGCTMSIAARVKTRTLWKNTLTRRLLRLLRKAARWLRKTAERGAAAIPLIWKTLLVLGILCIAELIAIAAGETDNMLILWFLTRVILIPAAIWFVLGLRRLQGGIRRIADGDLEHTISLDRLPGEIRRTGEDINRIGDGLSTAVEARLKSERFRAELITNVSHDIKTPLTSVISYTDLLGRGGITEEERREYLEVLQRQSARLKKLTEDLIEASKASTGNLAVHPQECGLGVLLEQVTGEYTERAAAAQLELILRRPETPVTVWADGQQLWRVLDNLMNNICKYALPGTRVYLDLTAERGEAQIVFRNISATPLPANSEDLIERFARADASRTTEGSGLGLSIADSLMRLQKGELRIETDGDLFKAILRLPLIGTDG